MGLVTDHSFFEERALTTKDEQAREIAASAAEGLYKQIISMRFTALAAREFAISRLPR